MFAVQDDISRAIVGALKIKLAGEAGTPLVRHHTGVPAEVGAQTDAFYDALPSLARVRDTAHHPEDRARGLDKKQKPLDLKPIDNKLISAPGGGVLVLDSLNGNRYGCTMADGHYGEVEVSAESLGVVQNCLQSVLNAFTWSGPRRHTPT